MRNAMAMCSSPYMENCRDNFDKCYEYCNIFPDEKGDIIADGDGMKCLSMCANCLSYSNNEEFSSNCIESCPEFEFYGGQLAQPVLLVKMQISLVIALKHV